ncbi:MAG: CDC48 family AAA ATPase [Aigarchaeota archaeon]|nr:CDC48 family AAA ATPase [Aigarchaeota archaeon]
MSEKKDVSLRVAEAKQRDIGRKIARVDSLAVRELDLKPGDIVTISGKKNTLAIVWPPYADDDGTGIVRIDAEIRRNAGVTVGDFVKISRGSVKPASRIVLSPFEPLPFIGDFGRVVRVQLMNQPVSKGDVVIVPVLGMGLELKVVGTSPSAGVVVTENTKVEVSATPVKREEEVGGVTYEDIGGLYEELQRIREMVELPMKHPELFKHLGIEPPKGLLLHGPPGTGKTLIAKALAIETGATFLMINGPEIMSKFYGESEARLREVFQEAEKNAPAIIFIDELDAIAPKRGEVTGEVERRVVSQLLTLMDGMTSRGNVVVIAATNRVEAVDPALRRPGRFDREIRVGVPTRDGRREILTIHTRGMPLAADVNRNELGDITHGFVGADLASLAREAAMNALRRVMPKIDLEKDVVPTKVLEQIKVTRDDFAYALRIVQPAALREIVLTIPDVKWEDVGGLESIKQELREAVEWPLKHPDLFKRLGIRPPRGMLLYGAPGTGKTLLAKAVATESEANFISVRGPEVLSKWVGESEKAVREIFRKARETAPCIIFFDELDSIAPRRGTHSDSGVTDRIVNQLLTEIDGLQSLKGVVVIGATNRPDILDPGMMRPGRFDRVLYVPPPDDTARLAIFKIHTKEMPLADDVKLEDLATRTDGYTGADVEAVIREAALNAAREDIKTEKVALKHFEHALAKIRPSLTGEDLANYERTIKDFKKTTSYIG